MNQRMRVTIPWHLSYCSLLVRLGKSVCFSIALQGCSEILQVQVGPILLSFLIS